MPLSPFLLEPCSAGVKGGFSGHVAAARQRHPQPFSSRALGRSLKPRRRASGLGCFRRAAEPCPEVVDGRAHSRRWVVRAALTTGRAQRAQSSCLGRKTEATLLHQPAGAASASQEPQARLLRRAGVFPDSAAGAASIGSRAEIALLLALLAPSRKTKASVGFLIHGLQETDTTAKLRSWQRSTVALRLLSFSRCRNGYLKVMVKYHSSHSSQVPSSANRQVLNPGEGLRSS